MTFRNKRITNALKYSIYVYMHYCERCALTFKTKKTLQTHLTSKKHENGNPSHDYKCPCGKSFVFRQGLFKHKQTCQYVESDPITNRVQDLETTIASQEERLAQYEKEREELRTQVAMLLEAHASEGNNHTSGNQTNNIENQTNNNIENQTNNNTINIHINAFGKENTEYLDDQAIVECIDRIFNSVPAILKRIHFDPDHPENHNIKITNKKLPYASVMGDNRTWKTVNKKDAIETMVAKGYNFLDEKYADTKGRLSKRRQQHFEGFQDKFADEDKEMHKQLMTNVELLVLNQGKD